MSKKMPVVQFRADEDVYRRAQERSDECGVKFTDAMRAALLAVAEGDVTRLSNVISGVSTSDEKVSKEWLLLRCHELFEYKDGKLARKYGSGRPGADGVVTRVRGGEECVLIHGKHYPLKDIIWLMHYGVITGEVIYKNKHRINDKHAIENLDIIQAKEKKVVITKKLNRSEKIAFCASKLRAISISTNSDDDITNAINKLINKGETLSVTLEDGEGWAAYRTGLHAFKIADDQFIVSLS